MTSHGVRRDMNIVCIHRKVPGLDLIDATKTQAMTAWALKTILTFMPKPWRESGLDASEAAVRTRSLRSGRTIPIHDKIPISITLLMIKRASRCLPSVDERGTSFYASPSLKQMVVYEVNRFGREPNDSWLAVVQSWAKSVGNGSEAKLAV
jgi:hypothetical protein